MPRKPICFVIQGYGQKTDLTTGRRLNLDASYEVIKGAVEDAGLQCLRSDELVHSGAIDRPIFKWLATADLVVADLSTYHLNTVYQLGIRYALRPHGTIVVVEDQFRSPFDITHLPLMQYKHLGDEIGLTEARRFRSELRARIDALLAAPAPDSPVYVFLPLRPPVSHEPVEPEPAAAPTAAPAAGGGIEERSAKSLLDSGRVALDLTSFWAAKMFLRAVRDLRPNDESVVHELAAATYKARLPDATQALVETQRLLEELNPHVTNNPATLRLWATVHRRLWELTKDTTLLDAAIKALERAFHVTQSYDVANDLAYALNLRAYARAADGDRYEAIADFVLARRMRREAIRLCDLAIAGSAPSPLHPYWRFAAMWEAAAGLEDAATREQWQQQAQAATASPWRIQVTRARISRIEGFLSASPLRDRPDPRTPAA